MAKSTSTRTKHDLDTIKADWRRDRGEWNLEDAEGFSAHREELLAYRLKVEAEWEAERKRAREVAIEKLMAPAHEYLRSLTRGLLGNGQPPSTAEILRALGEVLLPIVERQVYIAERADEGLRRLEDHVDKQVTRLDERIRFG